MSEEQREIQLTVSLDENQVPETIRWRATDAPGGEEQSCEAFLLSMWDGQRKASLRIDLWTKAMQVDHMNAFFLQTFMTLADTFEKATGNQEVAQDIRLFGEDFGKKVALPRNG
jgi:gliding motility-associated protein GldC